MFGHTGGAAPGKPGNLQQLSHAAGAGLGPPGALRSHANGDCTEEDTCVVSPAGTGFESLQEPCRAARAWEGGSSLAAESAELAGWLNLESCDNAGSGAPASAAAPGLAPGEDAVAGAVQQRVEGQDQRCPSNEDTQSPVALREPADPAAFSSQKVATPEAEAGAAEDTMTSLLAYLDTVESQVHPAPSSCGTRAQSFIGL